MSAVENLSKADPLKLALGAAVLIAVLYLLARKTVSDVVDTAGGLVSGNNAITKDTPYAGYGVAGTLGAATNAASGGALQSFGENLGGWIFDLTHLDYQPNP